MKTITVNTFHEKQYKTVIDGQPLPIAYHIETPDSMVQILETIREGKTRCRYHWGNIETGEDWGDTFDVKGYIGLSRGSEARYPILVYNTRSMGGGSMLTSCIVKITRTNGGATIYQHPKYHTKP